MYKQVRCIDILRISNKLKIPINKLTDEDIQNNITEEDKPINKITKGNLNNIFLLTMTFNFLKYLSR